MFFAVERGLFGVERRVFCCRALDISFCLFATQILRAHILQLTFDTQFWFLSLIGWTDLFASWTKTPQDATFDLRVPPRHQACLFNNVESCEQRTKLITSAKGRRWNGHRFLCVYHRSQGFHVCNKITQTCGFQKSSVFCGFPYRS